MTTRLLFAVGIILCLTLTANARHHKKQSIQQPQGCILTNDGRQACTGDIKRTNDVPKAIATNEDYQGGSIVSHPAGCPRRAFCGCGVSVKVFGKPVRELFLAANWFKFPRASAAPGMVAVRKHHVMYIQSVDANGNAIVYDPNSGGHKTRIHTRSLAGYRVVNPHS